MAEEKIVIPTKAQVEALLQAAIKTQHIDHMKTMGDLLGMKWVDSLLPKLPIEPEWDYYGLRQFCDENGISNTDTCEQALEKLN